MAITQQALCFVFGCTVFSPVTSAVDIRLMNVHENAFSGFANGLNNFNQVVGYEGYLDPIRGATYRGTRWDEYGNLAAEVIADGQATAIDDRGTVAFFGGSITGFRFADGSTQTYPGYSVGKTSRDGGYFCAQYESGEYTLAALGTPSGITPIPVPAGAFTSVLGTVNNNGVGLGHFFNENGLGTYIYRNGASTELTIDGSPAGAIDLNDANTILVIGGGYRRFSLDDGSVSALLPGDTVNPNRYSATAINNHGAVIGRGSDDLNRDHVLLWEPGESIPTDITSFLFADGSPLINAGRTQVIDINDHGVILGIGTDADTRRDTPFLLVLPEPSTALACVVAGASLRRRRK